MSKSCPNGTYNQEQADALMEAVNGQFLREIFNIDKVREYFQDIPLESLSQAIDYIRMFKINDLWVMHLYNEGCTASYVAMNKIGYEAFIRFLEGVPL